MFLYSSVYDFFLFAPRSAFMFACVTVARAGIVYVDPAAFTRVQLAAGRHGYAPAPDPARCMVLADADTGATYACRPLPPDELLSYSPFVLYRATLQRKPADDVHGVCPAAAVLTGTPKPRRWELVARPVPVAVFGEINCERICANAAIAEVEPNAQLLPPQLAKLVGISITYTAEGDVEIDNARLDNLAHNFDRVPLPEPMSTAITARLEFLPPAADDVPTAMRPYALALATAGVAPRHCVALTRASHDRDQMKAFVRALVAQATDCPWRLYADGLVDGAGLRHQLRPGAPAAANLARRLTLADDAPPLWRYVRATHARDAAPDALECRLDVPAHNPAARDLAAALCCLGLYVPLRSGGVVPRTFVTSREWLARFVGLLARLRGSCARLPPANGKPLAALAAGHDVLLVDTPVPMSASVRQPPDVEALRRHCLLFVGRAEAATLTFDAARARLADAMAEAQRSERFPAVVFGDLQWWSADALRRWLVALLTAPEGGPDLARRPDGTFPLTGGVAPFKLALCYCSLADDGPRTCVTELLRVALEPSGRATRYTHAGAHTDSESGARLLELARLERGNAPAWRAFLDSPSPAMYRRHASQPSPTAAAVSVDVRPGESTYAALRRSARSWPLTERATVQLADEPTAATLATVLALASAVSLPTRNSEE